MAAFLGIELMKHPVCLSPGVNYLFSDCPVRLSAPGGQGLHAAPGAALWTGSAL